MKLMVFHPTFEGFVQEWVRHICDFLPENVELFLCLPQEYKCIQDKSVNSKKIRFIPISKSDQASVNNGGMIKTSYIRARLIAKEAKHYQVDGVLILTFTSVLPFLPFLLSNRIKIFGVVHSIYLYNWDSYSYKTKLVNAIIFWLLAKKRNVCSVFILNDEFAARYFNRILNTTKFKLLTDPFEPNDNPRNDLRKTLNIDRNEVVFLHFGALHYRKGSMKILEAIQRLTPQESEGKCFVFAGRVSDFMRKDFYALYKEIKDRHHIVLIDHFCDSDYLHDLCYSSSCILIPYDYSSVSSGVIGYSAIYGKPVIGPSDGLLGKLIRRYKLGLRLSNTSVGCIQDAICAFQPYRIDTDYKERIRIPNFINGIFGDINSI